MGLSATVAQSTLLCGPAMYNVPPYRFGAPASYAPSTFAPHHTQYSTQGLIRQAQTLRNATTWWNMPSRLCYPLVGLPTVPSATSNAAAYRCPPFQAPYQQHPVPPLSAIHNTRCAPGWSCIPPAFSQFHSNPSHTVLSSPSEMSTTSTDSDVSPQGSPTTSFVHVVCNAPLIAPVPLPYHSPTFLQFDLPDDDEDLSHPPYVSRPHKRKRSDDGDEEECSDEPAAMKRRVAEDRSARWATDAPHPMHRPSPASHGALATSIGSCRYR